MTKYLPALLAVALLTAGSALAKPKDPIDPKDPKNLKEASFECSTGVLFTTVHNNSTLSVPAGVVVHVYGGGGSCNTSFHGPFKVGASRKLPGCPESVTTCTAEASWVAK